MSNIDVKSLNVHPSGATENATTSIAALAHPRFGLASMNPHAKEDVLLRNALLQGRFYAILESAAVDGIGFVRAQMQQLQKNGDIDAERVVKLERIIRSIERGFALAIAEGAVHDST
ncbi:MAG: hypothetical protein Q7K26_06350 [bacterium]|nr:hypothetical protein [bacterium]